MPKDNFFKRHTIPPFSPDGKPREEYIQPAKIGPYKVDALLDKGGMSLLYLGTHPETQAPITIKVLSPKYLSHPEMTARFLKEAEIIAMADHPNIIKLFGYGEWESGLYIAMEFVQGISLRQYLLQNPLSLKKSLELVLEIAYALCHLHTHGVIHRDLKPENILVDETGHIKVIDFGIAQLIDPQSIEKITEIGAHRLVGTPIYMSPEQRENAESVSYPSDIYSLGIIAYELILGKLSQGQVHLSLMPKGLQKILSKTLQPIVKDRYLDIVDFITDLSSYMHSPQFEKEKKVGDQAGELFEKVQDLQHKLFSPEKSAFLGDNLGIVIHRPLGFSSLYTDLKEDPPMLILAESASNEVEGLIQLLYFKGALDILLPLHLSISDLIEKLNSTLLAAPLNIPISCSFFKWDDKTKEGEFISCGYAPLWKINQAGEIESKRLKNKSLGVSWESPPEVHRFTYQTGDTFILSRDITTAESSTYEKFKEHLTELAPLVLPPQKLADAIYRKTKSQNIRYFDDHPFVVFVLRL